MFYLNACCCCCCTVHNRCSALYIFCTEITVAIKKSFTFVDSYVFLVYYVRYEWLKFLYLKHLYDSQERFFYFSIFFPFIPFRMYFSCLPFLFACIFLGLYILWCWKLKNCKKNKLKKRVEN